MTNQPKPRSSISSAGIDALWDFGQPAETEKRFRNLLPAVREGAVNDPSGGALLVELLTQIARTQGLQRRFDDAHITLDSAEAEAQKAGVHALPRPRLRLDLERGRALNSAQRQEEALPLFLAAWELGRTSGEEALAVDAAHMAAIVEKGQSSLEWNQKALELARVSTQEGAQKWVGSLTNNMGWSYHDLGEHERALACFEENAAWHSSRGQFKQLVIAKWSIARQLRALGRLDEALGAQEALAAEKSEPEGYTEEELAECLFALGRTTEATPHFQAAYNLLGTDPWFVANEAPRLARLGEMGRQN
jgi:tetratricopeptide (TPR) repeat protein